MISLDMLQYEEKASKKNITSLFFSSFFSNMCFDRAIWMLYLIEHNKMSNLQIGFAESLFHISAILFEIPTGLVSDIYGRRQSLIFSRLFIILYALGMIMFSDNIGNIYLIFILYGIGSTFSSGSDIAFLYDSINHLEKDTRFIKISGFYGSFITAGMAIGMFLGGILKEISWSTVYFSIAMVQVISIIFLLIAKDTIIVNDNKEKIHLLSSMLKIIKISFNVFKNKMFCTLAIGIVIFTASINTLYLFIPIWFKEQGFNETIISFVFSIDSIIGIIIYSCAYRIEKKIKIETLMKIIPGIALVCLLLLPIVNKESSIILFIIINNMAVLFYPLYSALLNKMIESKERATILSTVSFLGSIIIVILFPTLGFLTEYISSGVVLSGLSIFCVCSIVLLRQFSSIQKNNIMAGGKNV